MAGYGIDRPYKVQVGSFQLLRVPHERQHTVQQAAPCLQVQLLAIPAMPCCGNAENVVQSGEQSAIMGIQGMAHPCCALHTQARPPACSQPNAKLSLRHSQSPDCKFIAAVMLSANRWHNLCCCILCHPCCDGEPSMRSLERSWTASDIQILCLPVTNSCR